MAASEDPNQTIGDAIQSMLTHGSVLTPQLLTQITDITQQIRSAHPVPNNISVMTNAQLAQYNGNPDGSDRHQSETILPEKQSDKKPKREAKAVNAFLCFRSYYGKPFVGLTQKVKSGLLTQLWQGDNWKHFWTLEASAYSSVRNVHRDLLNEKISLDLFLTVTVGTLGVIPAHEYLRTMGWKYFVDKFVDQPPKYRLVKTDPAPAMHKIPLSTNLSAKDIIIHFYDNSRVTRPSQRRTNAAAGGVAMAFGANPTVPVIPIVAHQAPATGTNTHGHGLLDENTTQTEVVANADDDDETMTDVADETTNATAPVAFAENLSIETATADLQSALEDHPDEYPYAHHFHPGIAVPVLAFDPTVIQDDFDPFNLGAFVDFDI